jgi:raffinose/stachyose/melibiose transport system substrate-binding protein
MSGDDAPDIAEADGAMAPRLVAGKLLRPLNDYFDAYGWAARYPSSILSSLKASPDGKAYGTGDFWGVSTGGELTGVFYNKAVLDRAGVDLPATFDDFQAALATLHDKGEIPIQLGNLDQWSGSHVFSTLLDNTADPQGLQDWINGKPGATFTSPETKQALTTFKDWFSQGYISEQANGILDEDAVASFMDGQGAFLITGTWRTADISTTLGENGGFMLLPPKEEGGPSYATGSYQGTFGISPKTKNADLAAFFLDYITGPVAASINEAGDFLGWYPDENSAPAGTAAEDVQTAWASVLENNGLVGWLDSASPAMGDTLFPALQELMAGQQTPEQVMDAVQKTWEDYRQA